MSESMFELPQHHYSYVSHLPAGFAGPELPASWACVGRAPELEPARPPTPAAEWPVLDRSSQERTSHPQSVLCHRERGCLVGLSMYLQYGWEVGLKWVGQNDSRMK